MSCRFGSARHSCHNQINNVRCRAFIKSGSLATREPHSLCTGSGKRPATQGYDRYILSEEAWRRTHGFSEADKPAPDEIIRRLVVSKGQLPDALTEALLHWIAPQVLEAARAGNPQAAENIPPEVAQALGQPPSQAPAEPAAPEPTPFEDQSPTPPPGAPAPPTSRPRNPDEPITAPPRPAA